MPHNDRKGLPSQRQAPSYFRYQCLTPPEPTWHDQSAATVSPARFRASAAAQRGLDWTVRGSARGMRAILVLEATSWSPQQTIGGRFQPSRRAGDRSRSAMLRSPKQNRGTEKHPTPYEPAASPAKGGHRNISEAGGGEEKKRLDEILSGFVDNAGPSTKPDASGSFARQIGWEECALQCAVMVRSPVRAQKQRGALPLAVSGTVRRAVTRSRSRPALPMTA